MQITFQRTLVLFATLTIWLLYSYHQQERHYTIMIDPAGDARQTGRIIGNGFERTIAFQLAKELHASLQETLPCSVIITRTPGEIVYPQQNAHFANRLSIDLYVSLHCYCDPEEKYTIALYALSRTDINSTPLPDLAMIPLTKAHWHASKHTHAYMQSMYTTLTTHYAHQFHLLQPLDIPLAPLLGIQAPAIAIEVNCMASDSITAYIEPLTKSIRAALTS